MVLFYLGSLMKGSLMRQHFSRLERSEKHVEIIQAEGPADAKVLK